MPIPALITAGGSILGGVISSLGAGAANSSNLAIAARQNELNYKMFHEQNKFNLEQWHRNNAYNTPLEQRRRYENAGINPYLALGNISSGTAQAVKSATPAPAVGAQMQNSLDGLGVGIANAGLNAANAYMQQKHNQAQIQLLESQKKAQDIENAWKAREKQVDIGLKDSNMRLNDARIQEIKQMVPVQLEKLKSDIAESTSRQEINAIQKSLLEYDLNHLKPLQVKELNAKIVHTYSAIKYMAIQGNLASAQIQSIGKDLIIKELQASGIRITNDRLPETLNTQLKSLESTIKVNEANSRQTNSKTDYMDQEQMREWIKTYFDGIKSAGSLADGIIPL